MTADEVMLELYPDLPLWQRTANATWLANNAHWVKDGGVVISPRDGWVVKKIKTGDYKIVIRIDTSEINDPPNGNPKP